MTETRDISTIRLRQRHDQYAADSLEARNVRAALEAEGMTWTADFRPLFLENESALGGIEPVASHRALVRTDSGAVLGVHGGQYSPVQIADSFDGLQPLLDAGEARITRCGQLQGGKKVFVEATLERASGEVKLGDVVRTKIVARNSFDGTSPIDVAYVVERLRCFNGMTSMSRSALFRGRHTAGVHRELAKWRAEFAEHGASLEKQLQQWRKMTRRRVNDRTLAAYIREVLSPGAGSNEDTVVRGVDRIAELSETAPGAEPGTLWGAVNAVTYWATHERGRSDDARETSVLFGTGGELIERATSVAVEIMETLPTIEQARQAYSNHATARADFEALLSGRSYVPTAE